MSDKKKKKNKGGDASNSEPTTALVGDQPIWTVKTTYGYTQVRAIRAKVSKKNNRLRFFDDHNEVVGRFENDAWRSYVKGTDVSTDPIVSVQ